MAIDWNKIKKHLASGRCAVTTTATMEIGEGVYLEDWMGDDLALPLVTDARSVEFARLRLAGKSVVEASWVIRKAEIIADLKGKGLITIPEDSKVDLDLSSIKKTHGDTTEMKGKLWYVGTSGVWVHRAYGEDIYWERKERTSTSQGIFATVLHEDKKAKEETLRRKIEKENEDYLKNLANPMRHKR